MTEILAAVLLSLTPICEDGVCNVAPFVARPVAYMDDALMLRPHIGPIPTDEAPACTSCGAAPLVVVPEPRAWTLLAAGLAVLAFARKRRKS